MYGSQKKHNSWLKCHENEEKIENNYVLRNDHGIKTTQQISMNLVSFFSEDNVSSDEIKNAISNIKVMQIERSAFGGTPGIYFAHLQGSKVAYRTCYLLLFYYLKFWVIILFE